MHRVWMIVGMSMVLGLLAGAGVAVLPVAAATPELPGPIWMTDGLAAYHDFSKGLDTLALNTAGLTVDRNYRRGLVKPEDQPATLNAQGFIGACAQVSAYTAPLSLRGAALSPHEPRTLAFWWCYPGEVTPTTGFGLFELTGGRGLISNFVRGKGEWCGLTRPTGVFQVYYFKDITAVNALYDTQFTTHYDLGPGKWHHTALVARMAREVELYTDGKLVAKTALKGRDLADADGLRQVILGPGILVDEIALFSRALPAEQVAEYYTALTALRLKP
jgi:hypothetical protein